MYLSFAVKIVLVFSVFISSTFLFYIAAETLNPARINIINITYYSYMVFSFIGASLVFLGFRQHYLISKVSSEEVYLEGFIYISLLGILFPSVVILVKEIWKKLIGVGYTDTFDSYLKLPVVSDENKTVVVIMLVFFLILSSLAVLIFFINAKQIPFVGWLSEENMSVSRQDLTHNPDYLNPYIKSFVMLQMPVNLSFFVYIKMRTSEFNIWKILFAFYFFLSVVVKTYNYEKAPLVLYLFSFFVIEVVLGKVNNIAKPLLMMCFSVGIIFAMYYFSFEENVSFLQIYRGPISRIIFTQVAGFYLTLDFFPNKIGYLLGESLPTFITNFLGIDNSWNRSSRLLMEKINPSGVKEGSAGVINTIFMGEAYANWGLTGLLFSILYVAILFGIVFCLFKRCKKNTVNLFLYIVIFNFLTGAFQGGFVEYIFNSSIIFAIITFLGIKYIIYYNNDNNLLLYRRSKL